MTGRKTPRWRRLLSLGLLLLGTAVLAAWTLRARSPERPSSDESEKLIYLPLRGERLFTLKLVRGTADRYALSSRIECIGEDGREATELAPESAIACETGQRGRTRFRLDVDGNSHRLVLDGLEVDVPKGGEGVLATVGLGRDADIVLPVAGMGVEHLLLRAPADCGGGLLCVENGGLRGSLVIDSSARLRTEEGGTRVAAGESAPLLRRAPGHGEAVPVHDGDHIWAGQVPMVVERVRVDLDGATQVRMRIPDTERDDPTWRRLAGDRRWMSLELPSWPLAMLKAADTPLGWEADGQKRFVAFSREELFSSSPWPWMWRTHLADHRVEYELEERLQAFIDNELLCFDSDYDPADPPGPHEPFPARFRWNLETGVACDGSPIPPPEPELFRAAEEQAHDRETTDKLRRAAASLRDLPEAVPDPSELGFVFDWARVAGEDDMVLVPTRVLGVRPFSTRSGPSASPAVPDGDTSCRLARSGYARPPIDLAQGSTSAFLEVEEGTLAGSRLLLSSDESTICLGDRARAGVELSSAAVVPLGHLGVRGASATWDPAEKLGSESATCATFWRQDGVLQVTRTGPGELLLEPPGSETTRLEDLAEDTPNPLEDGARLRLESGSYELVLLLSDPDNPDRAAESVVRDERVVRRYPFGEDLAAVVGVRGVVYGGLESWLEPGVWREASEAWEDTCDELPAEQEGVELMLSGDLQRIIAAELSAVLSDTEPAGRAETVTGQAVLLHAPTGDLHAVVNHPSFDPNDKVALEELQARLRQRDGNWRAPAELENLAFRRNKGAGSVYKLATSYAMARGGLLDQPARPALDDISCVRMVFSSLHLPDDPSEEATLFPEDPGAVRTIKTVRCSDDEGRRQTFHAASASAGFFDAFRKSKNPCFALATIDLVPSAKVGFGESSAIQPEVSGGLWKTGGDLVVVLDPGFSIEDDLGRDNLFVDTLVQLGHRTHYRMAFSSQDKDAVNGISFPTVGAARWLPGVRLGGFVYPSFEGPEIYGLDDGQKRKIDFRYSRAGQASELQRHLGVTHLANYARLGYGLGGVQTSALGLAVMASPMARDDHGVVSPDLVRMEGEEELRLSTEALMTDEQADRVEAAMRAVVGVSGSTAVRYFQGSPLQDRIGGKTGTFATQAASNPAPVTQGGLARAGIEAWACGQVGATYERSDWETLALSLSTASGWRRAGRTMRERPYLEAVVADVLAGETPPHGFGAGAQACEAVSPNRAGVSANLGTEDLPVDGGVWLDEVLGLFATPAPEVVLVPGTSFVAVAFDGLAEDSEGNPLGEGYVLAVVVDGHDTVAKTAARRILERIAQYLEVTSP